MEDEEILALSLAYGVSFEAFAWILDYNAEGYDFEPPSPKVKKELSRWREDFPLTLYRGLHFESEEELLTRLSLSSFPQKGQTISLNHLHFVSSWALCEDKARQYMESEDFGLILSLSLSPEEIVYRSSLLPDELKEAFTFTTDEDEAVAMPIESKDVLIIAVRKK